MLVVQDSHLFLQQSKLCKKIATKLASAFGNCRKLSVNKSIFYLSSEWTFANIKNLVWEDEDSSIFNAEIWFLLKTKTIRHKHLSSFTEFEIDWSEYSRRWQKRSAKDSLEDKEWLKFFFSVIKQNHENLKKIKLVSTESVRGFDEFTNVEINDSTWTTGITKCKNIEE